MSLPLCSLLIHCDMADENDFSSDSVNNRCIKNIFLIFATFAVCEHKWTDWVRERKKANILYGTHGVPTNCDKQDTQSIDVFCVFFFVIVSVVVVVVAVVIFPNGTKTNGNLFCSFLFLCTQYARSSQFSRFNGLPFSFAHTVRFVLGGCALRFAKHPLSEHDIIKLVRFFASSCCSSMFAVVVVVVIIIDRRLCCFYACSAILLHRINWCFCRFYIGLLFHFSAFKARICTFENQIGFNSTVCFLCICMYVVCLWMMFWYSMQ